jgi:5-formyltetrahydrofolate cyclo-ligase
VEDPAGGDKAALRSRLLAVRAGLPSAVRDEASALIRERLEQLPELTRARALLGYAAFGAEVDLDPYLTRRSEEGGSHHHEPATHRRVEGFRKEGHGLWRRPPVAAVEAFIG